MEIFFAEPDVLRQPPANTHLLDIQAEPYPDGKRLRVNINLTPFQEKPYLSLTLFNAMGEVVASTSVIEPVTWRFELTLHIRKLSRSSGGEHRLEVILCYPDFGEIDRRNHTVEIPVSAD